MLGFLALAIAIVALLLAIGARTTARELAARLSEIEATPHDRREALTRVEATIAGGTPPPPPSSSEPVEPPPLPTAAREEAPGETADTSPKPPPLQPGAAAPAPPPQPPQPAPLLPSADRGRRTRPGSP